jgi:hypothetical protein
MATGDTGGGARTLRDPRAEMTAGVDDRQVHLADRTDSKRGPIPDARLIREEKIQHIQIVIHKALLEIDFKYPLVLGIYGVSNLAMLQERVAAADSRPKRGRLKIIRS